MASEQHDIVDGTLEVRTAIEDGTRVVSLSGELDLSNAETAKTALQEVRGANSPSVIDMRELEFIDSTGIALLVGIIGGEGPEVRFVPSNSAAVNRVIELTGLAERLPLAEA